MQVMMGLKESDWCRFSIGSDVTFWQLESVRIQRCREKMLTQTAYQIKQISDKAKKRTKNQKQTNKQTINEKTVSLQKLLAFYNQNVAVLSV